jgi:hypothetical protein
MNIKCKCQNSRSFAEFRRKDHPNKALMLYTSVSQPPGRRPVPDPGINYTGPREVLLENVILFFTAFFMNKYL